ncbi:MAG TPA: hypothetical protein VE544_01675 [Nitrososphaeraceae archaeon]|nr:hypothetical protein [Nitrososphaeraceae archaeon]
MVGRMCDANPNDPFCTQEDRDRSDGAGIIDNDDDRECENPPTAASCNNNVDARGVSTENNNDDWNYSCRDAGYDDGRNGPFEQGTYNHCGDEPGGDKAYLDGFIDGCISVEGNTRDVCESATDA